MNKSNVILAILLVIGSIFFISISKGYTKDDYNKENEYENIESIMNQKQSIYYDYEKSIVQICAVLQDDKKLGSGFFVSDNKIVTNYHVIKNAKAIYVLFNDDEMAYRAYACNLDKDNDLAVLSLIDKVESSAKSFELSTNIAQDEIVYACGFDLSYNVKASKVIAKDYEYEGKQYIKIDQPVNRGNSGGPVLNSAGQVVGVVMFGNAKSTSLIPAEKLIDLVN